MEGKSLLTDSERLIGLSPTRAGLLLGVDPVSVRRFYIEGKLERVARGLYKAEGAKSVLALREERIAEKLIPPVLPDELVDQVAEAAHA